MTRSPRRLRRASVGMEKFDFISEDVVNYSKPAVINYVAAIVSAVGSFLFGYDSGIISSVISENYQHFHSYFKPNAAITGAIVAVFAGGAFCGALMAGQTADLIGRKRTIQMGCIISLAGCAVQATAISAGMLIGGRVVAGWAVGMLSMTVPVYQAEISPPQARGLLSGWTQLMITAGFFVANWVGYACQFIDGPGQLRVPLAIQLAPAALLLVGMSFLPYSPRWLAQKGRVEEASDTLVRLHGGRKARPQIVEEEIQMMLAQIEWERENVVTSYRELISNKPNLHRTLCGCLIQAMCQWTGINVNNYFGPTIYRMLGYADTTTLLISGISGAWSMFCTFIFITFIVDRIGRRLPLIIGSALLAVCMAWECGMSAGFNMTKDAGDQTSNKAMGISGIAATFVFALCFQWSFGPVSWIYQSEIFPKHMRALGTSVSTASNWVNNLIIGQITPIGFEKLGYKYFMIYTATCVTNTFVCYFMFPETKNKTLEEIGLCFGDTDIRTPDNFFEDKYKYDSGEYSEERKLTQHIAVGAATLVA